MREFGSAERELFEGQALTLFDEAVAQGSLALDEPRFAEAGEAHDALRLLLDLGLLMLNAQQGVYLPVDPATVQSQVVAPMGHRGAQLLSESAAWAKAFGAVAQSWRRLPQPSQGPFTELHGEAIDPFIAAAIADAEFELLTAQPQTGRDGSALAASAAREIAALERGVTMRTLYQHSARRSAMTHRYVLTLTEHGGQVRTLDEFFNRLVVIDRKLAIIPGHLGFAVALAIREPSLIAYLVDMFERSWERARPYTNREATMMRGIAEEQRAMTIRMLVEGLADPTSAKRLGVSARTYAAYVADLKQEYNAQTRFQLGYILGQAGVSGNERR
ncbi:MAG: LuxR family transcriptional regulator [Nocardioides sp.]